LVAHSMGGLASRAYLQSGGYRRDVAALVTVGTPHRGSIAAQFVYPVLDGANAAPAYINDELYRNYWLPLRGAQIVKPLIQGMMKYYGIDLDLSSEGVRELAVVTADMKALNAGAASLPRDVRYVFVVGTLPAETAHEIL